jgi:uncharacterized protein DUF5667
MSTVFQLRRQAEEFAARVDAPAGSTVDARADPLLRVVGELRRHGELVAEDPRPEFAAALRTRLVAEAATVFDQQAASALPVRQRRHNERRLVVAATVAVLVGGSAGMAAASEHALPGEVLYPVKRVIESVRVGTATSSADRGRDLLSQASGRLQEVRDLLGSDSAAADAEVPATLAQFDSQARAGADELMGSYRDTGDPTTIATVRLFASHGMSTLAALSAAAPEEDQSELRTSEGTLRDIDQLASGLCQDCTSLPALELPTTLSVSVSGGGRALVRADRAGDAVDDHPVLVPTGLPTLMQTAAATPTPSVSQEGVGASAPTGSDPSSAAPPTAVTASTDPVLGVTETPGTGVPTTPDPTVTATEQPTEQPSEQTTDSADPSPSTSLDGSSMPSPDIPDPDPPDPPSPTPTDPLP